MPSYASLEETPRHNPVNQTATKAASAGVRPVILKQGRERLKPIGTRTRTRLVVLKDLGARRPSHVLKDTVLKLAVEKAGHA